MQISPTEIASSTIAALSLMTTLLTNLKRGANSQIDTHMTIRLGVFKEELLNSLRCAFIDPNALNKFKEELLRDLNSSFVDAKILDLQLRLRDNQIDLMNQKIIGLDHRTTRNVQHIGIMMDLALKDRRLNEDPRLRES